MLHARRAATVVPALLALLAPASAAAHHDAGAQFAPTAHTREVTASAAAVTWAGTPQRGDDRVNAVFAGEPQVKVVYAVLKGRRSRFAAAASLIQADADAVDAAVAAASDHTRTVRFDRGTSAGPRFVDIQVVRLHHGARAYFQNGQPEVGQGSRLQRELRTATHLRAGRDLLVYVDGLGGAQASGEADELVQDATPGAANRSNRGGRIAAVFGPTTLPPLSPAGLAPELALHELLHAFGAVQPDAPHATVGGHCYDGQDTMCYDDGSLRSGLYTPHTCQKLQGLVIDAPVDCGSDDYFAVSPQPGSYLATHWNTYDSAFLGSCADPRLAAACSGPPTATAAAAPTPADPAPAATPADVLRASGPLQRTDTATIGTVDLTLEVRDGDAVANVSATPVTLPPGSYHLITCLTLTSDGAQPWQQCWTREADGGPQRALEESLTVTRPPSGSAVVSGSVAIQSDGRWLATTPAAPAVSVPGA